MQKIEMTHGEILRALEVSQDFYAGQGADPNECIVKPLVRLSERLSGLAGYEGSLGVGYPFYAVDEDTGAVLPVPLIDAFHDEQKARVQESAAKHGDFWPCAHCQVANKLPNLTDQCNPCELVTFKPRDLFRTLPDIDAIAIFGQTSEALEERMHDILTDEGWIRFNTDIKGAFDNTMRALATPRDATLPIDFHIVTSSQLEEAFQKIAADPLGKQIGTMSRAWRAKWKDQMVDISYSLVFSMTAVGPLSSRLEDALRSTRRALLEKVDAPQLIDMVMRSRRCGPIIGDLSLRQLLEKRIASWRE